MFGWLTSTSPSRHGSFLMQECEHKGTQGVRGRTSTSSTPTAPDTFSAVCDAATRDNNDNISVRFSPRSSAELSNIWIDCVKAFLSPFCLDRVRISDMKDSREHF